MTKLLSVKQLIMPKVAPSGKAGTVCTNSSIDIARCELYESYESA